LRDYHLVAKELAKTLLNGPRTRIENAAAVIGGVLNSERAEMKKEMIEAFADLAEKQYSEHADWDRPLYSATQCGRWIASCIKSQLDGMPLTNIPCQPKLKRRHLSKRERDGDKG
jgi:hypothetical protein